MFWLEDHILRASSSTVCACTSKQPAIDRISCGSVINRVGMKSTPYFDFVVCVGRELHTVRPRDEQTASYAWHVGPFCGLSGSPKMTVALIPGGVRGTVG